MKSTRVYLIVILTLALISAGVLAWRQHLELLSLRGPTGSSGKDVAALEKRVWDAEQRTRELEAELAAAKQANPDAVVATTGPGGRGQNAQNGRGAAANPQQQIQQAQRAMQQIIQQPAYQAALAVTQKNQIDQQYAGLVRNLGLPPEQAAGLSTALMARNTAEQDAATAARAAGLDPRTPEYQQFVSQALAQANDGIRAVVGEGGLAALQQYDQTLPQRSMVTQFQQQLVQYGSGALLSDAQTEQLVSMLAASNARQGGGRGGPAAATFTAAADQFFVGGGGGAGAAVVAAFGGGGGFGGGMQVSQNVLNQAQQILSPVQYQALQGMQQAQQAQQTIQQLTMNAARGAIAPANGQQQGGRGGAAAGGGRAGAAAPQGAAVRTRGGG